MWKIIKFHNLLKVPALISDNTTVANIFAILFSNIFLIHEFSLSFASQHNFQI